MNTFERIELWLVIVGVTVNTFTWALYDHNVWMALAFPAAGVLAIWFNHWSGNVPVLPTKRRRAF